MANSERRAFVAQFNLHRSVGVAGALASALFVIQLPALADPTNNPGHAIANRFAEDAQRAEAQRKEAARKEAEKRRELAAKAAQAKAQKAYETEMLRRARAEAEERRKLEEDAARLDAVRIERETREAKAAQERAEKDRQIEAARAAENARLAEEARKAEDAKRAAEALRVAAEKAAADEARKADEAKGAEIARKAEEEARRADEARKIEEARKADEARRLAAERATAEQTARAEAEKRDAEARRAVERATADELRRVGDLEGEAEIARVAERLRRIREEHLARRTGPAATPPAAPAVVTTPSPEVQTVAGPVVGTREERLHEPSSGRGRIAEYDERRDVPLPPPRARPGSPQHSYQTPEPRLAPEPRHDGHVTVLLQMEPRYRRGRRYESMDPVLCTAGGCYVSNGPEEAASFLYGRGATRFGNAIGRRAGACNHAYTCVFRDVDLGALPAEVQPVDIRIIRHDRREPERIEALSHCRVTVGDRLACTGAIEGDGYTMWVISEAAAEQLPLHALGNGIADGERAEADPKLMGPRGRW